MFYRLIIVFLLIKLLSDAHGKVPVYEVTHTHLPPFVIYEKGVPVRGVLTEVFKEVLRRSSIHYQFKFYPPKRFYKVLSKGNAQITVLLKKQPGVEKYLVSKTPAIDFNLKLYWIRGKAKDVSALTDLSNTTLGVILGYSYDFITRQIKTEQAVQIEAIRLHHSAFRMLKTQRIYYLLYYDRMFNAIKNKLNIRNLVSIPLHKTVVYPAISKKIPDAQNILNRIDHSLQAMLSDGTMEQIISGSFASFSAPN